MRLRPVIVMARLREVPLVHVCLVMLIVEFFALFEHLSLSQGTALWCLPAIPKIENPRIVLHAPAKEVGIDPEMV